MIPQFSRSHFSTLVMQPWREGRREGGRGEEKHGTQEETHSRSLFKTPHCWLGVQAAEGKNNTAPWSPGSLRRRRVCGTRSGLEQWSLPPVCSHRTEEKSLCPARPRLAGSHTLEPRPLLSMIEGMVGGAYARAPSCRFTLLHQGNCMYECRYI